MSCIDNIVTIGKCDDIPSLSGFDLLDAPEITLKNADNIANETYIKGIDLLKNKKRLSTLQVRNQFIGLLQANNVMPSIADPVYATSKINPSINMGTFTSGDGERGVNIYVNNDSYRGSLRQTFLKSVECYPLASGDTHLYIYDSGYVTDLPITVVGNQMNLFALNYEMKGAEAQIRIDQSIIPFASAHIVCMKGCNNSLPNSCGYADGWDGTKRVKDEGFGINVNFYCHCNIEQILCDLSPSYIGELIWLKCRFNVVEEQWKTNRFNNWVIYNREQLPTYMQILSDEYNAKWSMLLAGLKGILNTYRDGCLNCQGIAIRDNI